MSENKPDQTTGLIDGITKITTVFGGFIFELCKEALRTKGAITWGKIQYWVIYALSITFIAYAPVHNFPYFIDRLSFIFPLGLGHWIWLHIAPGFLAFVFTVPPFIAWLSFVGLRVKLKLKIYQDGFNSIGLKNFEGEAPKVIDVIHLNTDLRLILVEAKGIDPKVFDEKKPILESVLNQFVQDIRITENNRSVLTFRVSNKELPKLIPFDDVTDHLSEPYSFLVGEGSGGFISGNLKTTHHLLVAGSSGGGKSFFVKQFLIGILESSERVQLYLIDLKRGVEMKAFEKLSNVFIAKENLSAIQCLELVVKEMDLRFVYFEEKGYTEIDVERDKMDRIVVLVDEASELFTKGNLSKEQKSQAEMARDYADKIAKLGRVAGIHLVLATQKVVKETIDTRVQTNINARMIFRVNTTASSMTVLGNKLAAELPEIPGRGIWSVGSHDLIVQTPKLDNGQVQKKVHVLAAKFSAERNTFFGPMLIEKEEKANVPKEEDKNFKNLRMSLEDTNTTQG